MEKIKMKIPKKVYIVRFNSNRVCYKANHLGAVYNINKAKKYENLKGAENYVENFAYGDADIIEAELELEESKDEA